MHTLSWIYWQINRDKWHTIWISCAQILLLLPSVLFGMVVFHLCGVVVATFSMWYFRSNSEIFNFCVVFWAPTVNMHVWIIVVVAFLKEIQWTLREKKKVIQARILHVLAARIRYIFSIFYSVFNSCLLYYFFSSFAPFHVNTIEVALVK